jgi:hypothetical protein
MFLHTCPLFVIPVHTSTRVLGTHGSTTHLHFLEFGSLTKHGIHTKILTFSSPHAKASHFSKRERIPSKLVKRHHRDCRPGPACIHPYLLPLNQTHVLQWVSSMLTHIALFSGKGVSGIGLDRLQRPQILACVFSNFVDALSSYQFPRLHPLTDASSLDPYFVHGLFFVRDTFFVHTLLFVYGFFLYPRPLLYLQPDLPSQLRSPSERTT